ncbi:MAG: 4-alpha-glucanotransferase [Sphaerochaetaceae bacterium]|nr:4-alpha-glucanotransferase [Spirochaetales bacterium]MDY5498639.1 4-alpha-glucanotransferase [Sphaerochaetaceae bacterium]
MKHLVRRCGVLLHPSSLAGREGIGTLGEEAYQFIDLLSEAHVTLWQMLPLGPTGYGDSPYAARSSFAGNELLIDLKGLASQGYLELDDVLNLPHLAAGRVDYGAVRQYKGPLLEKAAKSFLEKADLSGFHSFCKEQSWWLDDYALYAVLCRAYGDSRWFAAWPCEVKMRDAQALAKVKVRYADQILVEKVVQYFFDVQFLKMKRYANKKGVLLVGDIPIFVAGDSVDVWCNRRLFKLDVQGNQKVSSGVPPDAFSTDGQLWGNPMYNWDEHVREGWQWWTRRIQGALRYSDLVRLDHFRGFAACWEVPAGAETAREGKWVKAPGDSFFKHLHEVYGPELPFIAEDLGVITPDVEALRTANGLPGMKILQFAFGYDERGGLDATSAYLPHNCEWQSVIYTGTHDNDTTKGWYQSLDEGLRDKVRRYLECPDEQVVGQLVRAMLMSASRYAILPMQDWLELGSEARMNVPSTCGTSNWSWRMESMEIEPWRVSHLREMIDLYGRTGK